MPQPVGRSRPVEAVDCGDVETAGAQADLESGNIGLAPSRLRCGGERQSGESRDERTQDHVSFFGTQPLQLESGGCRTARSQTILLIVAVILGAALAGCAHEKERAVAPDPGPVHVHGLGVNPLDGALTIATHSGLWRTPSGATRPARVGDIRQDTMGFTVMGPDHFLASGHPDLSRVQEDTLAPHLGLIESRDGGRTWRTIAMAGEADFHVIRPVDERLLALNARTGQLLITPDGGNTWTGARTPAPFVDIVASPDAKTWIASGSDGLYGSEDAGASWARFTPTTGLLTWPDTRSLYLVTSDGSVHLSRDRGASFTLHGRVASPTAVFATDAQTLYVAAHNGTVYVSRDGGRSWKVRSRP